MDPPLTTTQVDDLIAQIAKKVPKPSDEECKIFEEEIQQVRLAAAIKVTFNSKRPNGAENATVYSPDAFRNLVRSAVKTTRDKDAALKALLAILTFSWYVQLVNPGVPFDGL